MGPTARPPAPDSSRSSPLAAEGATLRVLLVTADEAAAEAVAAALAEAPDHARFELARSGDAASAAAALAGTPAEVVLLGLPLPAREGLRSLVELQAAAPAIPVVVLCAEADEPLALRAVQLGARDYLLRERLYGTLLARSLLHAVESERVRSLLAQKRQEWQPLFGGGDSGARAASLHKALPDRFAALVGTYGGLLDRAVELALTGRGDSLDQPVQLLARQAAELRASPRDIVEIHAAAMKARESTHGPQRMKVYLAEGRVRLLELMGYLAGSYRELWLASGRGG